LSRSRELVDAVVLPAGGHDHVGCLLDQVKLTHELNKVLDEAMKENCQVTTEIATKTRHHRMGEDDDEDNNDDDGGDTTTPAAAVPPVAAAPEMVVEEEGEDPEMMVPE
jgi:hypothetical protein